MRWLSLLLLVGCAAVSGRQLERAEANCRQYTSFVPYSVCARQAITPEARTHPRFGDLVRLYEAYLRASERRVELGSLAEQDAYVQSALLFQRLKSISEDRYYRQAAVAAANRSAQAQMLQGLGVWLQATQPPAYSPTITCYNMAPGITQCR